MQTGSQHGWSARRRKVFFAIYLVVSKIVIKLVVKYDFNTKH